MSRKKEERKREDERGKKDAIYSGQLRLCQQPRAAHALRSDQYINLLNENLVKRRSDDFFPANSCKTLLYLTSFLYIYPIP